MDSSSCARNTRHMQLCTPSDAHKAEKMRTRRKVEASRGEAEAKFRGKMNSRQDEAELIIAYIQLQYT